MPKIKDLDYLFLSSYVHAREDKLINAERLERMMHAKTDEDAVKVLEECDWGPVSAGSMASFEKKIAEHRQEVFEDLRFMAPDPSFVDAFSLKYDYHNAKVMLKARAIGKRDYEGILSLSGTIPVKIMEEAIFQDEYRDIPEELSKTILEAGDVLARTSDPQLADFVVDRGYYEAFLKAAEKTGSEFLVGYVRIQIDGVNLRSAVRAVRMNKPAAFLEKALVKGGSVSDERIAAAVASEDGLVRLFEQTPFKPVLDAVKDAVSGGSLTHFEKLCDDVITNYLAAAKRSGFSEMPLIAYLCAVESEISAVRIVMTGRMVGLEPDAIRRRLREVI